MSFFSKIITNIKLAKDYKHIFCPFLKEIDGNLLLLEELSIFDNVEIKGVYQRLKASNKKKYQKLVKRYEELDSIRSNHNLEVNRILSIVKEFDKEAFLNNPFDYKEKIDDYYSAAKKTFDYKNLDDICLSFQKDAICFYDNYESILKQKLLYIVL